MSAEANQQTLTEEEALDQLRFYGYSEDSINYFRGNLLTEMSPRSALRYFIRGKAFDALSAANRGNPDEEWKK